MIDHQVQLGAATDRIRLLRQRILDHPSRWTNTEIDLLKSRAWNTTSFRWGVFAEAMTPLYRRASVTVAVLEGLTPVIDEGELIVGKINLRELTADEKGEVDEWMHHGSILRPQLGGISSHMAIDFVKVVQLGLNGIRKQIERKKSGLSFLEPTHIDKLVFYEACLMSLKGLETVSLRYADHAERLAQEEANPQRIDELKEIARICRKVPMEPATTFYEAVQSAHFVNAMLTIIQPGLYQLGRPDRYLYPYYRRDIDEGRITLEQAQEIWDCVSLLLNDIVPRGLAVGYMIGGRDKHGMDASNELTEIILESVGHTRLAYPGVGVCWHPELPQHLLTRSAELLSEGISHPAIYNDVTISNGLSGLGCPPADACEYIHSTCVEITPIGCSNVWVASPYINLLTPLHDAIGLGTGSSPNYTSFDELLVKVRSNLETLVAEAASRESLMRAGRHHQGGFPLLSCFVNDCISRGKDIDQGGARYDWIEMSFVGLANLTDSLVAIEELVFKQKSLSLDKLRVAMENDFRDDEDLRLRILNRLPKYGNADSHVDDLAKMATEWANDACSKHRAYPDSEVVPGFFCWIMHEALGRETSASADGRPCGFPLGDGSGPAQGRERKGPTAAVISTTSWDHTPMLGGIALNLKFTPSRDRVKFVDSLSTLIDTYCERGGFEVQVNVVDGAMLHAAQKHPEQYRDLVVRIGGYSDYFVGLSPEMQAEVMLRFEHGEG